MKPQIILHHLLHRMNSVGRKNSIAALSAVVLSLAASTQAAQIGLKFGINGSGGFQSAATGALLPTDVAGAPAYTQTNWNSVGRFGSNINPTNSLGVATTVGVNWDCTGNWGQSGGG